MGFAASGLSGSGSTLVYTTDPTSEYALECITFTIDTDATAGVHRCSLIFEDAAPVTLAVVPDWNEGGPSELHRYTFGRGLAAFACTIADKWAVQNDLPLMALTPKSTITILPVDTAGNELTGDAVSRVVLFGSLMGASGDGGPIPLIMPSEALAA